MPDSGTSGTEEGAWIHDLTPTLSDATMFDEEGCVQPLGALAGLPTIRRAREPLRLIRAGDPDRAGQRHMRHRTVRR